MVASATFATLIPARIARPLELRSTFVPESVEDLASLAPALSRDLTRDGTSRDVRSCYHPGWVSHGVAASTPSDIARFLDGLFGGRLLTAPSGGGRR